MSKELTEEEIFEIENTRPHVVILGAGATIATIPNGDKHGNPCSVMHGFVKNLGLESILANVELCTKSENIEDIYSELYERGDECKDVREQLEDAIFEYFSKLQLPDDITIYDKIVLALTNKDIIATFNWDPLLIQAYNRARRLTDNLPMLTFLHGNVAAGYCDKCGHFGALQRGKCDNCGNTYKRSPLLYPVKHKDYNSNPFIKQEWVNLTTQLSRAKLITIFGYSAPKTDVEAAQMLKEAFEKYLSAQRFNHIDIIERPNFDHDELSNTWREFINDSNCYYEIHESFYDSYLANSPRRTVECLYKRNMTGWWGDSKIKFNKEDTWDSVCENLMPLWAEEKSGKKVLEVNPITPQDLMNVLTKLDEDSKVMSPDDFYAKYESGDFKCGFRTPVPLEGQDFYRSRMAKKIGANEDLTSPATFSYVPLDRPDLVSRGRMNKEGQSMFYASLYPDTNFREICHDIKAGDEVYLAKWRMKSDASIMVFPVYLPENIDTNVDLSTYMGINNPVFAEGAMGDYFRKLSDLFTRTEEDENQRYLCSSFLANYILKQHGSVRFGNQEFDFKFEGIIYPSARKGAGEIRFSNIVMPPEIADSSLELVYVIKGRLKDDLSSVSSESIGFCTENKVDWYGLKSFTEDMVFSNIILVDNTDHYVEIDNHLCTDSDGKPISTSRLQAFIQARLSESILESVTENELFRNSFSYSKIQSKDDLNKSLHLICFWPVEGWKVDNTIDIKLIQFEIEVKQECSAYNE